MSAARPARTLVGRCLASTRGQALMAAPASPAPTTTTITTIPAAAALPSCSRRFHNSAPRPKRKTNFRNVKLAEMGLGDPARMAKYQKDNFPDYTPEQLGAMAETYSPEQLEAIRAGEAAVDTRDFAVQGRLRDDMFRPRYFDDFRMMHPEYDLKPEAEVEPEEPNWLGEEAYIRAYEKKMLDLMGKSMDNHLSRSLLRAMRTVKATPAGQDTLDLTGEEIEELLLDPELMKRYMVKEEDGLPVKKDNAAAEYMSKAEAMRLDEAIDEAFARELKGMTQGEMLAAMPSQFDYNRDTVEGVVRAHSAVSPELGKVPGVAGLYTKPDAEDVGKDDTGEYTELKQLTGMKLDEITSIYTKVLVVRQVHNQTRLGKIRSAAVIVIAGNGNGRLGMGTSKSTDIITARQTAKLLAIRNMKPVRRYENRTIYGQVTSKVSGTVVALESRPPGFGLRVPERLFEMFRAAGLHDMAAKIPRSKSPLNTVKATYHALMNQPDPEEIAIGRGKKMVDARKVYYGGAVY